MRAEQLREEIFGDALLQIEDNMRNGKYPEYNLDLWEATKLRELGYEVERSPLGYRVGFKDNDAAIPVPTPPTPPAQEPCVMSGAGLRERSENSKLDGRLQKIVDLLGPDAKCDCDCHESPATQSVTKEQSEYGKRQVDKFKMQLQYRLSLDVEPVEAAIYAAINMGWLK